MDRLATLNLFVRIVDRGSFSAAAAACGVSRPVAPSAIKALAQQPRPEPLLEGLDRGGRDPRRH